MKTIKVLLVDPRHWTIGVHSTFVPVGLGYIAEYLKAKIKTQKFDIKTAVHPDEIFDLIDSWKPDVLGTSNYIWSSNLAYRICEYAKEKKENVLCIMGGPEFPSGSGAQKITENIKKNCFEYLSQRPCVDYYCYNDGEPTFAGVIEKYIENNCNANLMKKKNTIVDGAMKLSLDKKNLLIGNTVLRLGFGSSPNKDDTTIGLDIIPSPYLSGTLDKYLNGKFIPLFETARGCPFLCTFCDIGLDTNKIVSFSTRRMKSELSYVCDKVTQNSGNTSISFCDSNWGLYKKDIILSDHILKLMNEKNWPSSIETATPKNKKQQMLDIDDKLKNRVKITLSQQSMNRDTLKLIKRDNMSNNEFLDFIKQLEARGKDSICELIVPMPNEKFETYLENVEFLMEHGVNIATYTLMMLKGAELGREEEIKKWGLIPKWRVIPRDFGIYKGKKIIETEKVCTGTNTMPYEDYMKCRKFSFLVEVFSYSIFFPIKRLYKELNISYFKFLWSIFQKLESKNTKELPEKLSKIYSGFARESEAELFDTKEEIHEFFSKEENYKKLLSSELGDNLLRKYSAKLVCDALNETFDFSINILKTMMPKDSEKMKDIQDILASYRLWIKNLYIFDAIFNWEKEKNNETIINLKYDIPKWYQNKNKSVLNFKKNINYKMKYNKENENLRNQLISLFGDKDKLFTLGKYFHQTKFNANLIERSPIEIG